MSAQGEFPHIISDFTHRLFALSKALPQMLLLGKNVRAQALKDFLEFLKPFESDDSTEGDSKKTFAVPAAQMNQAARLQNKAKQSDAAAEAVSRSMLTTLVSQYDAYLGNLISAMFRSTPELLNSSEKTISYSQLASFSSLAEVTDHIIEKEVESILRKSHSEHFEILESKLKMPLRKNLEIWPTFIELTERRNLIVHTDGRVSSQYRIVCEKHGYQTDVEPGEVLGVTKDYFEASYRCILEIGLKLGQVLWRKLVPKQQDEQDNHLIDVSYQLLLSKNMESQYPYWSLLRRVCSGRVHI